MAFNFNRNIPLYYQIKEEISNKIKIGVYQYGEQLPPEVQLKDIYGVSRPTIRQAINELVLEGVLTRGRGRGTFVTGPVITDEAEKFSTFSDPASTLDSLVTEVVQIIKKEATLDIAEKLSLSENEQIYDFTLVKKLGGEPLIIRNLYIPEGLLPNFSKSTFEEGSVYKNLEDQYDFKITEAMQNFQASTCTNQAECRLLHIQKGAAVMIWEGVLYSYNQKKIAAVRSIFRGDRFRFNISQDNVNQVSVEKL